MQRYANFIATKRGLATALHSGDPAFDALPGYFEERLLPALEALLNTAARVGEVRADIEPEDLLRAINGLSASTQDNQADYTHRMVALLADGLRFTAQQEKVS